MKKSKNQSLYQALPHSWIAFNDSNTSEYKYTCFVDTWNTVPISNINEELIKKSIARRVNSFRAAGGVVKEEFSDESISELTFCAPALNENVPDIFCKMNPLTFYCESCERVKTEYKAIEAPICPWCQKNGKTIRMKQLQFVYACECGFAEGVKPVSKGDLLFKPRLSQFKFFKPNGQAEDMHRTCPSCNKFIPYPKTATDRKITNAQNGSIVNLYNQKYADILKQYKSDAEFLMLGKWFGVLSDDDFKNILDNPKDFFEPTIRGVDDPEIIRIANAFHVTPEQALINMGLVDKDSLTLNKLKSEVNELISLESLNERLDCITSDLIEFDTLKYPKNKITLKHAIEKGMSVESIIDPQEIYSLIDKLGINDIQVSEFVQIVNYTYGFTRVRSQPEGSDGSLRLNGFGGKVYTNILETEGLLVEFDLLKIYKWLVENDVVSDDVEIDNERDAKVWFMENIKLESITPFSTITGENNRITKAVYSLLHTISHLMIISAGVNSGLSRDSLSEIIFPEAGSIFIYPTSSEGVVLGSVSGMFETSLQLFLEGALKDNEICTFDPVCSTNQNGACVACTYLNEVACTHFNKDLSRSYLYGGSIKINNEEIVIKKGFWK